MQILKISLQLCGLLISFIPSFIKIRQNLTEKKQFKYQLTDDGSLSQPISSANLSSQQKFKNDINKATKLLKRRCKDKT